MYHRGQIFLVRYPRGCHLQLLSEVPSGKLVVNLGVMQGFTVRGNALKLNNLKLRSVK